MNDPTLIGPCAEYEHELVDLHDGALAPERAPIVRLHLEQCPRCRAWAAAFAAVDARLAAQLPKAVLSSQFETQLRDRLAALARPPVRSDLRAQIEREHDSLIGTLHRTARRRAVLGAIASTAATLCALAGGRVLLAENATLLHSMIAGTGGWVLPALAGAAVAVAALTWSTGRSDVPALGLGR